MVIDLLALRQFRSYLNASFSFSPAVTLIVGGNAVGKTNIIESIYLLATARSFRTAHDREVIRWGGELSVVSCQLSTTDEPVTLELTITSGMVGGQKAPLKKYLVNGVARRQIDFVGTMRAVLFWPEDLQLVTDSPSIRRRYLDSVLVQVDREYRRNLVSYERGLRQRNRLLDAISEGKASRSQLLFWNQLLIKAGSFLTDARARYIDTINAYPALSVACRLEYDKSVISESRLEQYKDEEVAAKATLVGPHRDDFTFMIRNKRKQASNTMDVSLCSYGSRGEQRLAILWLKLAELAFIQHETGERPILLLDDIFSELDDDHRRIVLDIVDKQQTIVTSSEKDVIDAVERVHRAHAIIRL